MRISITEWIHAELKRWIKEGDICVDATVGKGGDTQFLCQCVGESGTVLGFDIQETAIAYTKKRLEEAGYEACLFQVGHEHMKEYVHHKKVAAIMFNLGYLPGGDHSMTTKPDTTVEAILQGLDLLKSNGILSLCIYSGGDSGFTERDQVLEFLKKLDDKKYLVIKQEFYNKENHPPLPIFIVKL